MPRVDQLSRPGVEFQIEVLLREVIPKTKSASFWTLSKGGGGLTRIQIVRGPGDFDNVQIGADFFVGLFP